MRKIFIIASGDKADMMVISKVAMAVVKNRGNYHFTAMNQDTQQEERIIRLIAEMPDFPRDFDLKGGYPLVVLLNEEENQVLLFKARPEESEIEEFFRIP
jgi:6-phosphogluconolactonase (cycloisomerase 2 family)